MTDPDSTPQSQPPHAPRKTKARDGRRLTRNLLLGLLIGLLVVSLALTALYLNRRHAAREILVGWLDRRGIEADVEVERIELDGFVGKITIGDPKNPQVRVDRVEVDYVLTMPWTKTGLGVTPSRIRLIRPLARASWKGGKLSLGSLDPLIEEFTSKPPRPDSRAPLVLIEKGTVLLDTEYGPVRLLADAQIDNSRLLKLTAELPKASLKSGGTQAESLSAKLSLTTHGERIAVDLQADAEALRHLDTQAQALVLNLKGTLPYPMTIPSQLDAPIDLRLDAQAAQLHSGDIRAQDIATQLNLTGQFKGWMESFSLDSQGAGHIRAASAQLGETQARQLDIRLNKTRLNLEQDKDSDLSWRLRGPLAAQMAQLSSGQTRLTSARLTSSQMVAGGQNDAFEIDGPLQLQAAQLTYGDLSLNQAQGQIRLDMVRDGVTRMNMSGNLTAQGGFSGLGPVRPDDVPEMVALKQSLGQFALNAPRLSFRTSNAGLEINLHEPVSLTPANGGQVTIEAGKTPLYALQAGQTGGGSLTLISRQGGGLPEAQINIPRWHQTRTGLEAQLDGQASMDFGPAKGIALTAQGLLRSHGGHTQFTASQCLPLQVNQLDLGENDLKNLSGQICPSQEPLLSLNNGQTRLRAALKEVQLSAPAFETQIENGHGLFTLDSRTGALGLQTRIDGLTLSDTGQTKRFSPLLAKGQVALSSDQWRGTANLERNGHELGHLVLSHDNRSASGQMLIQTPELLFSQYGLQPADISPLAGTYVQSPVEGAAQFDGRFDWAADSLTSSGRLNIPGLDFTSPMGKLEGLKGQVEFTSLAPLITAPDQSLSVDRLDTVVPLTDLNLSFALDEQFLKLAGGSIQAAGGRISIEPFDVPLTPGAPWGGVIIVDQVQLNELMKSANLQEKAELDSIVSGRLPFSFTPQDGWRIKDGRLYSVRPGRLSIEPEVFDELGTAGAATSTDLPPNTMQDLAYQALQDLAISDLTAEVNSLDEGRLGVRFRINGRHDPPQREQLKLGLMEFIRGDYLKKKLNLPSDTPIDLTLDTTWNANQIASDLMEYVRRGEKP